MSQPNLDQKYKEIGVETHLFECECGGSNEFLEIETEKNEKHFGLMFNAICTSLPGLLRGWFQNRRGYFASVYLSRKDAKKIVKVLTKWLEDTK